MRVLVCDGEQRSALAVVRSLGREGFEVEVCASVVPSLAGASRWCRREHQVPEPLEDPERFVHAISALARERELPVVLPVTDAALGPLLAATPPGLTLPAGPPDAYRRLSDKAFVLDAAPAAGLRGPQSELLSHPGALPRRLGFPLVLKPTRSLAQHEGLIRKQQTVHVGNREALVSVLTTLPPGAFPVLVQERVVGPGVGVFVLRWAGRRLAAFGHERLREKPPSGGVSVYARSIAPAPDLVDRAEALLATVGWNGVAMVEFKREEATGEPVLMEVNARFWGSLQLAIDSGVNFPVLLVRAALGEPVDPVAAYRVGTRTRWWWGDLDHLLLSLRRSPEALSLPPGAPGRLATVAAFLSATLDPAVRNEVCRWSDLRPAWRETANWLGRR